MFRALFGYHTSNGVCQCSFETVMTLGHIYVLQSRQMYDSLSLLFSLFHQGRERSWSMFILKITISISDMDKLFLLYLIFRRLIIYQSVAVHSPFPSKETVLFLVSSLFFCVPIATWRSLRMCFLRWIWKIHWLLKFVTHLWKVFFLPPLFRWNIVHVLNKISRRKQSQV